jgi:hypothetical protein
MSNRIERLVCYGLAVSPAHYSVHSLAGRRVSDLVYQRPSPQSNCLALISFPDDEMMRISHVLVRKETGSTHSVVMRSQKHLQL